MTDRSELNAMRKNAREAMYHGDFRTARSLLRYVLDRDPDDVEARTILASLSSRPKQPAGPPPVRSKAEPAPRSGFRNLSLVGATGLLLLLLVLAFLLPEGVTLASDDPALALVPAVTARTVASVALGGGPTQPAAPAVGTDCIIGHVQDAFGQPAGEGWAVHIISEAGGSYSAFVESSGWFNFADEELAAGGWWVELEIPAGWRAVSTNPYTATLSGMQGGACASVEFIVEALPCLCVYKRDADNTVGFPSGVGLPDWQMFATNGVITLTEKTDGVGEACFYDLDPNTPWTVTEETKDGWKPVGQSKQTVTLAPPRTPGECQWLEFVNAQCSSSKLTVCKEDPTGARLANWDFDLYDDATGAFIGTARTDAYGCVDWTVAPGCYTVVDLGLRGQGWKDWWLEIGSPEQTVCVGKCTEREVVFTNEPLGCIQVCKINENGDRLWGWNVSAINLTTGEQFDGRTEKDGCFNFRVPLGSYMLMEEVPAGWVAITPSQVRVDVTEAFVCENVRFKNTCAEEPDCCVPPKPCPPGRLPCKPGDGYTPPKDGKG